MGCVGTRNPVGGVFSLKILSSSLCASSSVGQRSPISCGAIFPVLHSSSLTGCSSAKDVLLLRASQSRCSSSSSSSRCCSSSQCSSSGRFPFEHLSSTAFSPQSSFAGHVLSSHLMRVASSRVEQEMTWRRRFHGRAKAPGDDDPQPVYSADTKMRSEVISPFRSLRMFFYLAFVASGTIGSLITLTRFAAALGNTPSAQPIPEIVKDLGIDLAAVTLFALLYRSDARARDVSLAKLSREEMLSALRIELSNKKVVTLQQLRGVARIVIISGSSAYVKEAFQRGETYREDLLARGVLVVPYTLDGGFPASEPTASTGQKDFGSVAVQEQPKVAVTDRWAATPIYTNEWSSWLNTQKKLANVAEDTPVYISLRLDGRVRGSGVGYPPWGKFAIQLPPMTGLWKGPLDGMDGRI